MSDVGKFRDEVSQLYIKLEECKKFIINPLKKREYAAVIAKLRLLHESVSSPNPFFVSYQKSNSSRSLSDISAQVRSRNLTSMDGVQSHARSLGLDTQLARSHVANMNRSYNNHEIIAYANQMYGEVKNKLMNMPEGGGRPMTKNQIMSQIRIIVSMRVSPDIVNQVSERIFNDITQEV